MVELEGGVEDLLGGRLDAMGLLVLRVDAERGFGHDAGAAEERELFKHERLAALVDGRIRSSEAAEAAATITRSRVSSFTAARADGMPGMAAMTAAPPMS